MKSQVSMEFIFMIMSAMFMVIMFMVVFSEVYQDNLRDKKRILAEDFGYSVQNEIIMAARVSDGYQRYFTLPGTLEGFPYEVAVNGHVLRINYTDNIFDLPIPLIKGIIHKGDNKIQNLNRTICVNC